MRALLLASFVSLTAACGGNVEAENEQTSTDSSTTPGTDSDTTVTDSSVGGTEDGSVPPIETETGTVTETGTITDSGSTGTGAIKCGMETCASATQECCVGLSGAKCVAKGGCGGGSTFTCSDTKSCPSGQVCCAERTGGTSGGASCKSSCSMGIVLCSTNAECPMGQTCTTGIGGFKYCRGGMGGFGDGGFGGFDGGFGGFDAGGFGG